MNETVQQSTLRLARDYAGGVSLLSRQLNVSAGDLDAMIHGHQPVPTWVFLRAADFVNQAQMAGITPPGFPKNWLERKGDGERRH